jgi:hypothetical protein
VAQHLRMGAEVIVNKRLYRCNMKRKKKKEKIAVGTRSGCKINASVRCLHQVGPQSDHRVATGPELAGFPFTKHKTEFSVPRQP